MYFVWYCGNDVCLVNFDFKIIFLREKSKSFFKMNYIVVYLNFFWRCNFKIGIYWVGIVFMMLGRVYMYIYKIIKDLVNLCIFINVLLDDVLFDGVCY